MKGGVAVYAVEKPKIVDVDCRHGLSIGSSPDCHQEGWGEVGVKELP